MWFGLTRTQRCAARAAPVLQGLSGSARLAGGQVGHAEFVSAITLRQSTGLGIPGVQRSRRWQTALHVGRKRVTLHQVGVVTLADPGE